MGDAPVNLYLSGPMTGYEDFNYPAFHAAKACLEAHGYECISPADLPLRDDWEWVNYIEVDIGSVFAVDGIARLEGWEQSKGARIENKIAEHRGLPCETVGYWLNLAAEVV